MKNRNRIVKRFGYMGGVHPEVGEGWIPIVEEMLYKIEKQILFRRWVPGILRPWVGKVFNLGDDFHISLIKEKFGILVVYFDFSGNSEYYDILDKILAAAKHEASHTCEVCGSPAGVVEEYNGWVSVRCFNCSNYE